MYNIKKMLLFRPFGYLSMYVIDVGDIEFHCKMLNLWFIWQKKLELKVEK